MSPIPRRLSEQLASRKIIPFIGAGFSIPSGASSWSNLINALMNNIVPEKVSGHADFLAQLSQPDLADVVDSLIPTSGPATDFLVDRINSSRLAVHEYQRSLLDLQCPTIVTTNWDTLIEKACDERRLPWGVVYRDRDVGMFDPSRRTQLIKIHGTISDPASVVYRKSDYAKFWSDRPLLLSLLTTLGATNSFLFIGYGFGDPNILDLLDRLQSALSGGGRGHYALIFEDSKISWEFGRRGVEVIKAPEAKDSAGSVTYESRTLQFLRDMGHHARTIVASNVERARLINAEIKRLIDRLPVRPALRMRGSLGWLSNPDPVQDDPIYGSYEQDKEERQMTELVTEFLEKVPNSSVRCILHIAAGPLADKYQVRHIRRRLDQLRQMVIRYPRGILVVHDQLPSYSNHMFFDEDASALGFKSQSEGGISRVVVVRDAATIRAEIEQFELDFATHLESNRKLALQLGVDVVREDWLPTFIEMLIAGELRRLESTTVTSETAGEQVLERLADALAFAIVKHAAASQLREDGRTPYGVHLLRVVDRLRAVGAITDEEILIAAASHDLVEDCDVTVADIQEQWGGRVAGLVDALTQRKGEPAADYIGRLRGATLEAKAIKLADRWDNVCDARKLDRQTFGGVSLAAYLDESLQVLEACREGNARLASRFEDDLSFARLRSGI
jgi:hypothetical protein